MLLRRRSDGAYLILTSSKWEDNHLRSQKPDLPGGMVEPGESLITGLQRELVEEIGFTVSEDDLELVFASTYIEEAEDTSITFLLYFAEVDDIEVTLSWEHESFEWMSAEAVMGIEIRPPYPAIFSHFKTVGLLR